MEHLLLYYIIKQSSKFKKTSINFLIYSNHNFEINFVELKLKLVQKKLILGIFLKTKKLHLNYLIVHNF